GQRQVQRATGRDGAPGRRCVLGATRPAAFDDAVVDVQCDRPARRYLRLLGMVAEVSVIGPVIPGSRWRGDGRGRGGHDALAGVCLLCGSCSHSLLALLTLELPLILLETTALLLRAPQSFVSLPLRLQQDRSPGFLRGVLLLRTPLL